MTRPTRRPTWMLVLALVAGCVPLQTPGAATSSSDGRVQAAGSSGAASVPGAAKPATDPLAAAQPPAGPAPRVSLAPGQPPATPPGPAQPGVGPQAAGIIGKLKTPTGLVAGPGFGLLALAQAGVAGATVTLVDAAGAPVSDETATTDAAGAFAFARLPASDRPFFVRARFAQAGQPLVLTAPAEPDGTNGLTVDIDAASTLVAARFARLLADGTLPAKPGARAQLLALEGAVREALADAGALPFLGEGAGDLVAAFDQLALDTPAVGERTAKLAAGAAERADEWTVTTVLDGAAWRAAGAEAGGAAPEDGEDEAAGLFALDPQGRVHVATASTPVRILRLDAAGAATEVAQLPADLVPPASLAFAPDGTLHAAALDEARATWVCAGSGGTLAKVAGGPIFRSRAAAGLGRIAVDAEGTIFAAAPRAQVIIALKPGRALPRIVAGALGQVGHQDGRGDAARFRRPTSVAFGPDGALWVADTNNACVRRLTWPVAGGPARVETVVGQPGEAFYRNGRGAFARVGRPTSVAAGPDGTLYLTDAGSARVRRITPQGSVFLVAGAGTPGSVDGPGPLARFTQPGHVAIAPDGALWVHDLDVGAAGGPAVKLRRIARTPR